MSYIGSTDFNTNVGFGLVSGYTLLNIVGRSDGCDTNDRIIHAEMDVGPLSEVALHDTPAVVKVASTSAADALAGPGTGAHTVLISGVNSAGALATESVDLTGQTEVTTSTTWRAIHATQVTAAGTGLVNAGVIWVGTGTFTSGVPATKYDSMEIGANISRTSYYNIPDGHTFLLRQFIITLGDTSKDVTFDIHLRRNGLDYKLFEAQDKTALERFPVTGLPALLADDILYTSAHLNTGSAHVQTLLAGYLKAD